MKWISIKKHKSFWSQKTYMLSAVLGVLLLVLSMCVNYFANAYVNLNASNSVTDLILDHLPTINVDLVFFDGFVIFWLIVVFLLISDPHKIPFTLKSIATFVLIRSAFIILTHIAEPLNHSFLDTNWFFSLITTGNDLFFSSHTGLPFLMALIYWENKKIRYIFLFATVFFGTAVLLGHLHYSIDVFAALFITYGISHIAQKLFPQDYQLLLTKQEVE